MTTGRPRRVAPGALACALAVLVTGSAQASGPAPRVVVLDTGTAMHGAPIRAATAAARALLTRAGGARVGLITAGRQTTVVLPLTTDARAIGDALAQVPATGGKARLLDATFAAVRTAAGTPGGSVVVISSGQDAGGRATVAQVRAAARNAHVSINAVGAVTPTLSALVGSTGGSSAPIRYVRELPAAARHIAAGLPAGGPAAASPASPGIGIVPLAGGFLLAFLSLRLLLARRAHRPRAAAVLVNSWIGEDAGRSAPMLAAMEETPLPDGRGGARWRALAVALEQADMALAPRTLVLRTILGAAVATALFWAAAGLPGALVGAALVPLAVRAYVKRRVRKRHRAFADQLADTVQAIASAMRAGHGLSSAVAMIADDAAEPMASELRRIVGAERLGVPLDEALEEAVRRTGNADLEQLALVAILQREVGGNAAEALDRIVDTIRHRDEVQRLVRTLTAQGQLSRWVLTSMPVALGALLASVGTQYMRPMFHTTTGLVLLVGSGVMIVIGSLWIRRIIEVEV